MADNLIEPLENELLKWGGKNMMIFLAYIMDDMVIYCSLKF